MVSIDTARPRILVVDDDPMYVRMLNEMLSKSYVVFGTSDGRTALTLAKKHLPDLVLLDIMMQSMDGHQVCRELKADQDTVDIPVIFLTGRTDVKDIALGFELGAVDYIVKPFSFVELNARVNTHVQLRLARQQIARQNQELEEQLELFLKMIPHDLRTSLAIIQFNAERLRNDAGRGEQTGRELEDLEELLRGCKRQKELLTDLMDVGRLRAGTFTVRKMLMPVDTLIASALANAGDILEVHRFRVLVPDDLAEVRIDGYSMERVLVNLLANAQKYADPGSTIVIRAWCHEGEIVVAICNEGEFISPEDLDKIFVPYYHSHITNTTEGVGLGLHLAKLLVEAHGGRIWAECDRKRGNRFCFSLPLD